MAREPFLLEARDFAQAWKILVPSYESVVYAPLLVKVERWNPAHAEAIAEISPRRANNRCTNYFIPKEIERVGKRLESRKESSIRFGFQKPGRGYHGERGDFCLVGGSIDNRNLSLMYRSLELIGGLGYDLVLIERLGGLLGIKWKSVQIFSTRAHVFALKRNSNEKLYPKLKKVFDEN